MNQEHQNTILQYLNSGKKEDTDLERHFARLFCDKNNEAQLTNTLQKDWEAVSSEALTEKDLTYLLHRIHFRINSEKSQSKTTDKHGGLTVLRWYSRIAAVLLVPLLLWAAYQFSKTDAAITDIASNVQVVAPLGSRIRVSLPDGSSAWLNSGSVLEYQVPFKQRKLLVRGEVYFNVVTDSLRPLIVEGPRTFVKVLGTKFNVKMWPNEEITEVVLAEGSVEMTPKGSDKTLVMVPGDKFVYDKTENLLSKSKVNPDYYSAWIEGKLVLRGVTMEQAARELSRWFNVEVEVRGTSLKDHLFRATFEDEKLEEVLRLLKMTAPIKYEIIDNQQQANGDFARKKVIISHR